MPQKKKPELPLRNFAMIGSGIQGTQIAMIAARAGYGVTVYDPRPGAFRQTFEKIRADLKAKKATPVIPWNQWEACARKIRPVRDLAEAVAGAELILEAVPENLEVKRRVWAELGRLAPAGAIIATNSSSMPVSRLEGAGGRPEQVLNIHFYFPMQGVNMVDIMGGSRTRADVMAKGIAWIRSIGFIPLTVNKELLGFCFNRVWRAIKRETLFMWGDGFVDFRDIDRAWMVFTRMQEGPFALMDKVGLDVIWDIEMVYHQDSKDPKDHPPGALREMIDRGELGVKSGRGFYTYPDPEFLRPGFLK